MQRTSPSQREEFHPRKQLQDPLFIFFPSQQNGSRVSLNLSQSPATSTRTFPPQPRLQLLDILPRRLLVLDSNRAFTTASPSARYLLIAPPFKRTSLRLTRRVYVLSPRREIEHDLQRTTMATKPERSKRNGSSIVLVFGPAPRMALGGEFLETRPLLDEGSEDVDSSRARRVRRPASDVGIRIGEKRRWKGLTR